MCLGSVDTEGSKTDGTSSLPVWVSNENDWSALFVPEHYGARIVLSAFHTNPNLCLSCILSCVVPDAVVACVRVAIGLAALLGLAAVVNPSGACVVLSGVV